MRRGKWRANSVSLFSQSARLTDNSGGKGFRVSIWTGGTEQIREAESRAIY